jgi:hypothetical protein
VLEAGELVALRAGRRQVVMTQLHVGWAVRAAPRPGRASAAGARRAGTAAAGAEQRGRERGRRATGTARAASARTGRCPAGWH